MSNICYKTNMQEGEGALLVFTTLEKPYDELVRGRVASTGGLWRRGKSVGWREEFLGTK